MSETLFRIKVLLLIAGLGLFAASCQYMSDGRRLPFYVQTAATLNDGIEEPFGIAEHSGAIYISDGSKGVIWRLQNGVDISIFASGLDTPSAIAFDKAGNLIVADSGSSSIRSIDASGKVTTIAGIDGKRGFADGEALKAQFNGPIGVAVDNDGRIFVADTYNDRIRIIENGNVRTLAGSSTGYADGTQAKFNTPSGIALLNDKLIVADMGNRRIRIVEPSGIVSTFAGSGEAARVNGSLLSSSFYQPTAIAVDEQGSIYVTDLNAIRIISGVIATVRTLNKGSRGYIDGTFPNAQFSRPSGIALDKSGTLYIADSDDRAVRKVTADIPGGHDSDKEPVIPRVTADEFRKSAPGRWPYDPPDAKRDIAGTLGELRGDIRPNDDDIHFHNGLDIAGGYGETARAVRTEKVLLPLAAQNYNTLRELIRLPTMGYIHVRLGRRSDGSTFGDDRFQFISDATGKVVNVRVPRGARFNAGEPIGTLNAFNHVHLIAGPSSAEMNAIDALILPGISDSRPPMIQKMALFDRDWHELETPKANSRITVTDPIRIVVRAYDQVDGNAERRRLGLYKIGYQVLSADGSPLGGIDWTIIFDRLPPQEAVRYVYALGSHSGATGETIFNYIATNRVEADSFREDFFDPAKFDSGNYTLRAYVSDYFGNQAHSDIAIEVKK